MYVFVVLLIIILGITILGIFEYLLHQKRIYSIPIRIHVNGTRGKSSVTRLIGAALNEGGIKSITKVTGTNPRLILEDGTESVIHRKMEPNIIEQLSIVKFAAEREVQALVVECMALQPQYQIITENQMIHSTVGVITNVRLDHMDIMGYSIPEIADTLTKTIPKGKILFTAERSANNFLKDVADKKNSIMKYVNADDVNDEEMSGFSYIEHKDNVALALAVSLHLGVVRKVALQGMYKASPDPGVLQHSKVEVFGKQLNFYNAFAANDAQSTLMIWRKIKNDFGFKGIVIVLLNTRQDRMDRARQLTEMVGQNLNSEFDYMILIGQSTDIVNDLSVNNGVDRNKIFNLGWVKPSIVLEKILSFTTNEATVLAIGNMGGMGADVAQYFHNRSVVYG